MAIAAGVIGDERVVALLAAHDMAAERRRATALDRRHDLELAEAHMAGIGFTPCRAMAAEDIRDLQRRTRHACRASGGRLAFVARPDEAIERARDLADDLGCNLGIARGGIELDVAEQRLDHADVDVVLQQMRRKAVPKRMRRYTLCDPGRLRGLMAGAG